MKYYSTPIMMAIIKKKNKCWQQCVEIKILLHLWWEYKAVQLL